MAIEKQSQELGDLGLVVEQYAWSTQKDLSVNDVYEALCAVEQMGGTGSQEEKVHALYDLLCSLDQHSAKFVVRIVLGKLRLVIS